MSQGFDLKQCQMFCLGVVSQQVVCGGSSGQNLLPGIFVYLIGQRYFVEGIVMTGLKS